MHGWLQRCLTVVVAGAVLSSLWIGEVASSGEDEVAVVELSALVPVLLTERDSVGLDGKGPVPMTSENPDNWYWDPPTDICDQHVEQVELLGDDDLFVYFSAGDWKYVGEWLSGERVAAAAERYANGLTAAEACVDAGVFAKSEVSYPGLDEVHLYTKTAEEEWDRTVVYARNGGVVLFLTLGYHLADPLTDEHVDRIVAIALGKFAALGRVEVAEESSISELHLATTEPSGGSEATHTSSGDRPLLNFDTVAIDRTVEDVLEATTTPGAVVLARQGESEYLAAYGTREYDGGDAVTVDDHFRIGSNTKTMTGTVILQLVDEGALALDDPVSTYLPEVPNGDNITIAQLLEMRSGLHNYSELITFNRVLDDDPQRVWQPAELVAMGFAEDPYFAPGEGFHYSNTNTVLLGMIIEEITHNSAAEEFRTRIFEPLGLDETLLPALDDSSIPEPHPRGYLWGTNESTAVDPALPQEQQEAALAGEIEPSDVTDDNPSWGWTAGAAISTARDLATYVEAMVGGGLLSTELQTVRLDSLQPIDGNDPGSAQYGLALARLGPLLGHDGSLPGFQSVMGHDPETGLTLIVFTNLQAAPSGEQTANLIAQQLIPVLYADSGASSSSSP